MNYQTSLCFAWGQNSTSLTTADVRLSEALELIYGAFLRSRTQEEQRQAPYSQGVAARVGGEDLRFDSLECAVHELEDLIARQLLAGCEHLLLHAGAVTDGLHIYIVLGHSGAGKTTMTLEFVARGLRYITDEYVAIERSGEALYPFPRSTVVKRQVRPFPAGCVLELPGRRAQRSFVLPENRVGLEPLQMGEIRLVFPSYQENSATSLLELDSLEACARMLPHTFNFECNEADYWPTLSSLGTGARGCGVVHGDVCSAVDEVLCFFDS